jgi:NADPH:quinone reductase-like Zn-dependent oxidoreductase
MKAIVHTRYGEVEALELREVDKPVPADDEVLVRVRAASLNPVDWYGLAGRPYVARVQTGIRGPKEGQIGVDFAGTVEAVGASVTRLQPGDEVFGGRTGAFAEYVRVRDAVARKPANLTFEQAAAVPVAAITALQGLRDKGRLQPGQKVLVNGASGGVGTFAVQIAKWLGADVAAVCSTRNVEAARSLGADHVVDYTQEDFTRNGRRYDLLLDIAGNRSWRECTRVLERDAAIVVVGGPSRNRWTGPIGHMLGMKLSSLGKSRRVAAFVAKLNAEDLDVLRKLLEDGTVKPVIERSYQLSELGDAFRYLGEGHAQGKLVITL